MAPLFPAATREVRRAILTGWLLLAAATFCHAVVVTVKQRNPLESLSPTGDITGVSEAQVGAQYTLVNCANGQATVRDAHGNQFRLAVAATDYTPPAPTPATAAATTSTVSKPASTSTNTAPATSATSDAAVQIPSPPKPRPAPRLTSDSSNSNTPTVAVVNIAMDKPFFSDQPIWQETALLVAQRLGLGLEGRTLWEASYRHYFSGQPTDPKATILGNGAYCVAIYADADDHPTSILIAFANDGDFRGVGPIGADLYTLEHPLPGASPEDNERRKREFNNKFMEMETTFEPIRKAEQADLTSRLTLMLGDPQQTTFGTDEVTKESALRWDWNGSSFLLTCEHNKYNLLRIVPTALADSNGRTPRIARDDIGHKLSGAVEHRPNGDVIITQIPMANQGPKGYCVPATWERVLRYTGVPGDMYTLSRIGDAGFGGGEAGLKVADQLNKTLNDYGRHVDILHPSHLDYIAIRHYIDDGIPIFWGVNVNGYEAAEQRYSLCERDKDFDTWKKLLDQARTNPQTGGLPPIQGHQVLIIGYNPDTKEIAWTDPWGRETKERWMTQEEAQRCTLDEYYVISW
jgi:hypothetical protein